MRMLVLGLWVKQSGEGGGGGGGGGGQTIGNNQALQSRQLPAVANQTVIFAL